MPGPKANDAKVTGGLNEEVLPGEKEPFGGTGGSAGGGTRVGRGDASGGETDAAVGDAPASEAKPLESRSDAEVAREASALGPTSGTLADAAADSSASEELPSGPVAGEAVDAGAGRGTVGSGTPSNRGGSGGGGPLGQHGGAGPTSSD